MRARVLMVAALLCAPAMTAAAEPGPTAEPGGLSIEGVAASRTDAGEYGLGVWARSAPDGDAADGQFRYGQKGAEGERGVAGRVRCLTRDATGLIQISGTIFGSAGDDMAGKDFAATVDADSDPQRFSGLRLGEPGTIEPCSGGTAEFHDVTQGGYRVGGAHGRPGSVTNPDETGGS